MKTTQISKPAGFSRRDLLKAGGAIVVSFAFGVRESKAQGPGGAPAEVDSFLALHADGSVTVYTGKVDMGTGLRVAIRQMAAEELEVPVERVTLIDGDTARCPDQGGTGGSTGLTQGGAQIRQAAATARDAMRKLPAGTLQNGQRFNLKVDAAADLSRREQEVLSSLLENMANKEIGNKLNISERTVKFHVSNLLNKFGVRRRADLILLCYQKRSASP